MSDSESESPATAAEYFAAMSAKKRPRYELTSPTLPNDTLFDIPLEYPAELLLGIKFVGRYTTEDSKPIMNLMTFNRYVNYHLHRLGEWLSTLADNAPDPEEVRESLEHLNPNSNGWKIEH